MSLLQLFLDTNFNWTGEGVEREAVRFSGSLMNILMSYSRYTEGRFLYLSTQDVYGHYYAEDIGEIEPAAPEGIPGIEILSHPPVRFPCRSDTDGTAYPPPPHSLRPPD